MLKLKYHSLLHSRTDTALYFTIKDDNDNNPRYAIGFAERSGPKAHIGWLAGLANATDQPYTANNTGGPSIKVSIHQVQVLIQGQINVCLFDF